jgi:hypothetical protein
MDQQILRTKPLLWLFGLLNSRVSTLALFPHWYRKRILLTRGSGLVFFLLQRNLVRCVCFAMGSVIYTRINTHTHTHTHTHVVYYIYTYMHTFCQKSIHV